MTRGTTLSSMDKKLLSNMNTKFHYYKIYYYINFSFPPGKYGTPGLTKRGMPLHPPLCTSAVMRSTCGTEWHMQLKDLEVVTSTWYVTSVYLWVTTPSLCTGTHSHKNQPAYVLRLLCHVNTTWITHVNTTSPRLPRTYTQHVLIEVSWPFVEKHWLLHECYSKANNTTTICGFSCSSSLSSSSSLLFIPLSS